MQTDATGSPWRELFERAVPKDVAAEHEVLAAVHSRLGLEPPSAPRLAGGRYLLAELLGQGGAGVVYAAHDRELQRRVAVKFVRSVDPADVVSRARSLLREARTVATLTHPNIVAVYDVGYYDALEVAESGPASGGGVYVVMELVDGCDLGEWLGARRDRRAILRAFERAGEGLAAAHRAGVVHRDFKPANVLVTPEGICKVADFGLARAAPTLQDVDRTASASDLDAHFTDRTQIRGTVPYMAPEQFEGKADAHSDQFSFCVALFEALSGRRPYPQRGWSNHAAKLRGPPSTAHLPPAVASVVARGLHPDPGQRFRTMDELLDRLRRRSTGWSVLTALVCGVAVFTAGGLSSRSHAAPTGCDVARVTWDPPTRSAIASGLRAHEQNAPASALAAVELLDDRVAALDRLRVEACEAEHEPSRELLWCLELRGRELSEAIESLGRGVVPGSRALEFVERTGDSGRCAGTDTMFGLPHDPARARPFVDIRSDLSRARRLVAAGLLDEAWTVAGQALRRAEELDFSVLSAEALSVRGYVAQADGRVGEAENLLTQAFWNASVLGHHEEMVNIAATLAFIAGKLHHDWVTAARWERHAQAALQRLSDAPRLEAVVLNVVGANRKAAGDFTEAADAFERAAALLQESAAGEHELALVLNNWGEALSAAGRYEDAEQILERSLALRSQTNSAGDPALAATLAHFGSLRARQKRWDEAARHHERALEILENHDPAHPWIPTILNNLGGNYGEAGRYDEAIAAFQRAIELEQRASARLGLLDNLATAQALNGDVAAAIATYRRAAWGFLDDDEPVASAMARVEIARLELERGRYAEARAAFQSAHDDLRVAATQQRARGVWQGLAELSLRNWPDGGAPGDPVALARAALEAGRTEDQDAGDAGVRFLLARALARAGDMQEAKTHARAVIESDGVDADLAEQARTHLASWDSMAPGVTDGR